MEVTIKKYNPLDEIWEMILRVTHLLDVHSGNHSLPSFKLDKPLNRQNLQAQNFLTIKVFKAQIKLHLSKANKIT